MEILNVIVMACAISFFIQSTICIEFELIFAVLQNKSLEFTTIFACLHSKDVLKLTKELSKRNIRSNVYNLDYYNFDINTVLYTPYHVGVIADVLCNNSKKLLQECGHFNLYSEKYHWLLFENIDGKAIKILNATNINVNVDITLAKPDDSMRTQTLIDVYNPRFQRGGKLIQTIIGKWNKSSEFPALSQTESKYYLRRDMTNITFKTQAYLPKGYTGKLLDYLNRDNKTYVDTIERCHFYIVTYIRDYFQFDLEVSLGESWGFLLPNGTGLDGVAGAVNRSEIDFGGVGLIINPDRLRFIQFIGVATQELRQRIVFRHPKVSASKREPFLVPLDKNVWYFTIAIVLSFIALLKLVTLLETKITPNADGLSLSYIVLISIASLCQQGSEILPKFSSSRIMVFCLILFSTLLYQFYSASIVSSLLMDPPKTIKSVRDLINSKLQVGAEDIIYNRKYFNGTYPLGRELYQKMLQNKNGPWMTWQEGIEKVKRGGFAFQVETETVYHTIEETFSERAVCELSEIAMVKDSPVMPTVGKNSPFKEMFYHGFLRLLENGVIHRTRKHWSSKKPECSIDSSKMEFHLGIEECKDIFILFFIGAMCSCILMLAEMLTHRKRNKLISILNKAKSKKVDNEIVAGSTCFEYVN